MGRPYLEEQCCGIFQMVPFLLPLLERQENFPLILTWGLGYALGGKSYKNVAPLPPPRDWDFLEFLTLRVTHAKLLATCQLQFTFSYLSTGSYGKTTFISALVSLNSPVCLKIKQRIITFIQETDLTLILAFFKEKYIDTK